MDALARQDRGAAHEAVAGVVGGKLGGDIEVHAQQILNGVVILRAIEPAQGDTARIGILGIDFKS